MVITLSWVDILWLGTWTLGEGSLVYSEAAFHEVIVPDGLPGHKDCPGSGNYQAWMPQATGFVFGFSSVVTSSVATASSAVEVVTANVSCPNFRFSFIKVARISLHHKVRACFGSLAVLPRSNIIRSTWRLGAANMGYS